MSRAQLTSTVEQNTGGVVAPFVAGKNKIINGDFNVNQRNFSSATADNTYTFDRWQTSTGGGCTYTAQTFTVGSAPVAGYEATNFMRLTTTGQSGSSVYSILTQKIESVRTFAGQTVTLSFWARAGSGTPKVAVEFDQYFGSSGSSGTTVYANSVTLSTSWQRYSVTYAVPSIAGQTISGGNDQLQVVMWVSAGTSFNSRTGSLGIQSNTFDFWGVQLEAGSVATPFTTASGTLQGELALCQRYYWRGISGASYGFLNGAGFSYTSSNAQISVTYPVTMRAIPSSVDYSSLVVQDSAAGIFSLSSITLDASVTNTIGASFAGTTSGMTTNRFLRLLGSGSTAYIGFSAEL